MVTRCTPINLNEYIKVYDDDKILKLSQKGYFPIYVDSDFAYFESNENIMNVLVDIIQNTEKQERG